MFSSFYQECSPQYALSSCPTGSAFELFGASELLSILVKLDLLINKTHSDPKLLNHIYFTSSKSRFTDQESMRKFNSHLQLHSSYTDVRGSCRRKRRAMEIEVSVISAKGLRNADDGWLSGTSDPYCICVSAKKTSVPHRFERVSSIIWGFPQIGVPLNHPF